MKPIKQLLRPERIRQVADERIAVVARIANLATERNVDVVLVAGDVFDLQTVSDRVIRRLFAAMDGFKGRRSRAAVVCDIDERTGTRDRKVVHHRRRFVAKDAGSPIPEAP